ncbi:MAG TPA: hypothetical protein VM934_04495 [Pyrinomonadaceae bacterium]|jgi:hypothetical protein|nr:hypothetical protein [Pyrinomonadaceae bacterium]
MFGLDKIFGGKGLLGSFFDSIGMSWMNNLISLAVNISTGNWLAAAKDVFDLVSQFSSDSWQNRVDRFQPLGAFATGGCFGSSALSESRADEFRTRASSDDPGATRNSTRTIFIAHETRYNNSVANEKLREAYTGGRA